MSSDNQAAPFSTKLLWAGRIVSRPASTTAVAQRHDETLEGCPGCRGLRALRLSPERHSRPGDGRGRLHHSLPDSADRRTRCDLADWLSGRRNGHARPRRRAVFRSHYCRRVGLAGAVLARRAAAGNRAVATLAVGWAKKVGWAWPAQKRSTWELVPYSRFVPVCDGRNAAVPNAAGLPGGYLRSTLHEAEICVSLMPPACPADTYARRYAGRKEPNDPPGKPAGFLGWQGRRSSSKPNDPPGKPAGFPAARGPWISNQATGFRNTFQTRADSSICRNSTHFAQARVGRVERVPPSFLRDVTHGGTR